MSRIHDLVEQALGVSVVEAAALGGGDVAESHRVAVAGGDVVFAKTKPDAPPGFFVTEAAGLRWLRETGTVAVPEVLAVSDDPPLLVLEWIEPGLPGTDTEADLGRALAALHGSGAPSFGREDRRSTGSRGLPNDPAGSWPVFYAERRLLPLVRLAGAARALPTAALADLETVAGRIDDLVGPEEPPARLHGDLWAGNRMIGRGGVSWLIDPACFGGHREFDLAMMRLFGGFDDAVFAAYAEELPLAAGWERRVALYHLAPLVVHAIKFGGGYVGATHRALDAVLVR